MSQKILLIEDEDTIRESIIQILSLDDYNVVGASGGVQGLEMALSESPDLILCDIMMPDMDGKAVLERLRQDDRTASIPFIFLTACADRQVYRTGMELGADDYITKPIVYEELKRAISCRLDKKEASEKRVEERFNIFRSSISGSLPNSMLTPLTSVYGYSELLTDPDYKFDSEEFRQIASDIHAGAQCLHRTIRNYLLYVDLELLDSRGTGIPGNEIITEADLVISEKSRNIANDFKRIDDLELSLKEGSLYMCREFFEHLINELVEAAFRTSEKGTRVQVKTIMSGEHMLLEVRDQGEGLPADQVEKVMNFERFGKEVDEPHAEELSLIVVKKIADMYKMPFNLKSTEGEGTHVQVGLPFHK